MDANIKRQITDLYNIQEERMKAHFKYLRTITIILVGLLSFLVGIKADLTQTDIAQCFFLVTITLLGLGILFSAITQSYEIVYLKEQEKVRKEMIKSYMNDKDANKYQVETIKTNMFFLFSEILTYACLILSIITLIAYSYSLLLKI